MSERFCTELENFECSILETVELSKKYGTAEFQNKKLYADMINKINAIRFDAKKVSDIVQCGGDLPTIEHLESMISKVKNKRHHSRKSETHQLLTKINEILNPREDLASSDLGDDDLYVQADISPIDPITKQNITNPVRNKICNHYYEKTTILDAITQNPRLRCPMVGCGVKNFITPDILIEDYELMQKLKLQIS